MKYVLRQRGKSILLGSIFFVSLLISLLGIVVLRVTDEMIADIGGNSNASISIFSNDFLSNTVLEEYVARIQVLDNIQAVNRSNRLNVMFHDDQMMGDDPDAGIEFYLTGMDDLSIDGPFFWQTKRLAEGRLDVSGRQVLVEGTIAASMGWELGDTFPLRAENGTVVEVSVAGTYHIFDPNQRESQFRMYAHPDLINAFQGAVLYSGVQFFVESPSEIETTKVEIENLILNTDYHISVFDDLYQRLKAPVEGLQKLIGTILYISLGVTGVVVSLLLVLWVRERRRETAILLSIGETKKSIILQRLLEVLMIFSATFIGVMLINHFIIPNIGSFMYGMFEPSTIGSIEIRQPRFYLTFADLLQSLAIGGAIIVLSVLVATLPLIQTHPKAILASVD